MVGSMLAAMVTGLTMRPGSIERRHRRGELPRLYSNRSSCPPCIPGTSSSPITSAHSKVAGVRQAIEHASAPRSAMLPPLQSGPQSSLNSASRRALKPSCAPPAVDPPKPVWSCSRSRRRLNLPHLQPTSVIAAITFDTACYPRHHTVMKSALSQAPVHGWGLNSPQFWEHVSTFQYHSCQPQWFWCAQFGLLIVEGQRDRRVKFRSCSVERRHEPPPVRRRLH